MENQDSSNLDSVLKKSIKAGGGIIFFTLFSYCFAFITKILVVRNITENQFGLISLALTIFNITALVSIMGMTNGVIQRTSTYFHQKDSSKFYGTISFALQIAVFTAFLVFFASYFLRSYIGRFFNNPYIPLAYLIFLIGLPFHQTTIILISAYRGLSRIKEKIYFEHLIPAVSKLIVVGIVVLFGLRFRYMLAAHLFPFIFTSIAILVYSRNALPSLMPYSKPVFMRKDLIMFSFPLFGSQLIQNIMCHTDMLMIGRFKTLIDVGLYSVAQTLSAYSFFISLSIIYLFIPIATALIAKKSFQQLKHYYSLITRWSFLLTSSIFFIFVFFPKPVITLIFSNKYIHASSTLQILIFTVIISVFLGPGGSTLISLGKTKDIFWVSSIAGFLNFVLNILFIPKYGATGAALALVIATIVEKLFYGIKIYVLHKIHPFEFNYIKMLLYSLVLSVPFYFIGRLFLLNIPISLFLLALVYQFTVFLILKFTNSFDKEDNAIISAVIYRIKHFTNR